MWLASELMVKDIAWDPQWPPLPNAGRPAQPIKSCGECFPSAQKSPHRVTMFQTIQLESGRSNSRVRQLTSG